MWHRVRGVVSALALLCAAPALAQAQQQQFGQSPPNTYVTWGTNTRASVDVTYFIGAGFSAAQTNLINQAATQWSAVSNVHLIQVGTAAQANVQFSIANLGGGTLANLNRNATLQPGTLNGAPWAQIQNPATVTFSTLAGTGTTWWTGGAGPAANQFDFYQVALDVMGYSIGLGLLAPGVDPTSVMQNQFAPGVAGSHQLSTSDVQSVQAIYGAPEPATLGLFGVGLSMVALTWTRRRRAAAVRADAPAPPLGA